MYSGERENRNYQEHEKASFFFYLSCRIAFLFYFWENVLLTSDVACYYCYLFLFMYKIDIFHISCAIALFFFIIIVFELEVNFYFVYILFLYQNFYYV